MQVRTEALCLFAVLSVAGSGLTFGSSAFGQDRACTRHIVNNSSVTWGADFVFTGGGVYDYSWVVSDRNGEEWLRSPSPLGGEGGPPLAANGHLEAGQVRAYTYTLINGYEGFKIATLTLTTEAGDSPYNQSFDLVIRDAGCPYIEHRDMPNKGRATLNEPVDGDVILSD